MRTSDELEKGIQYVETYTEQKTFAHSINFLYSFEEYCC